MPPSVTNCVPGDTGVNQPRGRNGEIEVAQRIPRFGAQTRPSSASNAMQPVGQRADGDNRRAGRRQRRIAVRTSEPACQRDVARDLFEILGTSFGTRHPDAAPSGKPGGRCRRCRGRWGG